MEKINKKIISKIIIIGFLFTIIGGVATIQNFATHFKIWFESYIMFFPLAFILLGFLDMIIELTSKKRNKILIGINLLIIGIFIMYLSYQVGALLFLLIGGLLIILSGILTFIRK